MLILNVAEKNDAAKTIANLLSGGQVVKKEGRSKFNKIYQFKYNLNGSVNEMMMTSVSGHMMNLEFPVFLKNWETVDPLVLFDSQVIKACTENMVGIKRSLEELIRNCRMLVIWTDCDREGENIGMEIVETCLAVNSSIVIKRAKFSEITYQSVTRAIHNLVDMNRKLSQAVDVRQEVDLKLGAAFTRLQTLFLRKRFPQLLSEQVISYGSCQFPTLGFVVERYKEVENFITEPFWKIVLKHEKKMEPVEFNWDRGRLFDEDLVNAILANITDGGGSLACVIDVSNKSKSKWRPFAMDTIEMEKLASRKLKINPKRAMQIAEKLYSQSFISYPRTETNIFPKDMNLEKIVQAQVGDNRWGDFATQLLAEGIDPHNGKKSDQAHPPIHPLKQGIGLQGEEASLFELITRHFLACLSKNALGHETKVSVDCISKSFEESSWPIVNQHRQRSGLGEGFTLTGLSILERNYLDVYPYDKWSDKEVPVYKEGEIFLPTIICIEQGATSSPSFLTEADLITLMDKHGIGTDATHAEHIDKVKTRNYIGNTGPDMKYLIPGKLGMGLVEGYDLMGFYLSRPNLRAKFESDLENICQGIKNPQDVLNYHLNEYKVIFKETVRKIDKLKDGVAKFLDEIPVIQTDTETENTYQLLGEEVVRACPLCPGSVTIRKSNSDTWFLGCNYYSNCKHVLWLPSSVEHVTVAKSNEISESFVKCDNYHDNTRGIPVHKISIKLNINIGLLGDVFPDEQRRFVLCLYCNDEACETLNIKRPNLKEKIEIQPDSKPKSVKPERVVEQNNNNRSFPINPPPVNRTHVLESNPVCYCGDVTVIRQVNKEGFNKGKQFYTCSQSKCQMFAWVHEKVNNTATSASHSGTVAKMNNSQSVTILSEEVKCKCGHQAILLTVKKENQNKGRQFYSCSQAKRCEFFQWADEPIKSTKTPYKTGGRKRAADQISKNITDPDVIMSTETRKMWPPPMNESRIGNIKQKSIRRCTVCRQPGHRAKKCPER